MKLVKALFSIGIVMALSQTAFAENEIHENAGTRAAAFLKMESGARGAAMAGAHTGVADDVDGLFWNPAGLTAVENRQLNAMQNFSFGGINHETVAYAQRLSDSGVLAANFQGVFASIDRRAGDTLEVDSTFTAATYALGVSYAQSFGGLSLGGTVKGVQERFDVEEMTGAAFDLGVLYRTGRVSLGASVLSLGTKLDEASLPTTVRLGGSARLSKKGPLAAVDWSLPNDDYASVRIGLEQWFYNQVALRAGYQFGKGENPAEGFAVGIGLLSSGTKMLENVDLQLDYAFVPERGVGDSHRVSILTRF